MATDSPSQMLDRIMVRLPSGMRGRLTEAAKGAGRSVNAEVVSRLEASFVDDAKATAMAEQVSQHEENITELWARVDRVEGEIEHLREVAGLRQNYD